MTIEQIIQCFHKQTVFKKTGNYPRKLKNPMSSKYAKEHLSDFKNFLKFCEKNKEMVDWELYIESLADFYKGWFSPSVLTKIRAIKIYRNYISSKKSEDPYEEILKNLKFVFKYMKQNNIERVQDYFIENQYLIPTLAKHHSAGSVSIFFIALFSKLKTVIALYPQDVKDEFFYDFEENINLARAKNLKIKKLRKIMENPEKIINNMYNIYKYK
jgi:hypothetical protein